MRQRIKCRDYALLFKLFVTILSNPMEATVSGRCRAAGKLFSEIEQQLEIGVHGKNQEREKYVA